ncbi:MAG TPA: hypothetical protein VEA40_16805 [Ramlibacter sp.]|nr:hypothetical protein [Ramlibacter sp.]
MTDKYTPRHVNDRATAPAALESIGETAWLEFQRLQHARSHAEEQAAAPPPPTPAPVATALTAEKLLELAHLNGRTAPLPQHWELLHALLPRIRQGTQVLLPPQALLGAAWDAASDIDKRMRLREQIRWAERHHGLRVVYRFLASLAEDDWGHA